MYFMFNINCDKISSLDTTCTFKYIFTCLLLTIDCINIYLSCPSVYGATLESFSIFWIL